MNLSSSLSLFVLVLCSAPLLASVDAGAHDTSPAYTDTSSYHFSVNGLDAELLVYTDRREAAALAARELRETLKQSLRALDPNSPASALQRLQRAGEEPVVLRPDEVDVLAEALRIARLSSGAYDPTVGAVRELWSFGSQPRVPDTATLQQALKRVDHHRLNLNIPEHTARVLSGTRLHLGQLSTGHALQVGALHVQAMGFENFILRLGGHVVAHGNKGSRPWMLGVQDPRGNGFFAALPVDDRAVATVSDNDHYFIREGARFHDIIDPRTGVPARPCRSVTVVAQRAGRAAALAQAVFVLGPDAGLELVEKLQGVEAIIVDGDNRVRLSSGLGQIVRYRPPTDGL